MIDACRRDPSDWMHARNMWPHSRISNVARIRAKLHMLILIDAGAIEAGAIEEIKDRVCRTLDRPSGGRRFQREHGEFMFRE